MLLELIKMQVEIAIFWVMNCESSYRALLLCLMIPLDQRAFRPVHRG